MTWNSPLELNLHLISSFKNCFKNSDGHLTMAEFMEGSKQDQSIIQALSLYDGNKVQSQPSLVL
jgi:hypothetical protein